MKLTKAEISVVRVSLQASRENVRRSLENLKKYRDEKDAIVTLTKQHLEEIEALLNKISTRKNQNAQTNNS